jgi:hypothetical protein
MKILTANDSVSDGITCILPNNLSRDSQARAQNSANIYTILQHSVITTVIFEYGSIYSCRCAIGGSGSLYTLSCYSMYCIYWSAMKEWMNERGIYFSLFLPSGLAMRTKAINFPPFSCWTTTYVENIVKDTSWRRCWPEVQVNLSLILHVNFEVGISGLDNLIIWIKNKAKEWTNGWMTWQQIPHQRNRQYTSLVQQIWSALQQQHFVPTNT